MEKETGPAVYGNTIFDESESLEIDSRLLEDT